MPDGVLFGPAAADLARLEEMLRRSLLADPVLASEPMGALFAAGGKRIRPALVLLCAQLGTYDFERVAPAAMAVELTHAATLVHDDVIDRSAIRRGLPTVLAAKGEQAAIVVGDFYFAKAYWEASRCGDQDVVAALARAIMRICQGELQQQLSTYHYRPTIDRYLRRIQLKTASLLAASCEIGGLLGGLDEESRAGLARYGNLLGLAFQIADDVLDYSGTEQEVGKPVGHDLLEGFATLPLMLALEDDRSGRLREVLVEGGPLNRDEVRVVVELVRASGALERALERAGEWAQEATWELAGFGAQPAARALAGLARYVVTRNV